MKVKCVRLLNSDGEEVESSSWLTLGGTYHVLGICYHPTGTCDYRIVTSECTGDWPVPAYHRAQCFKIVSTVVPSNWHLEIFQSGAVFIEPKSWLEQDFWVNFFDHDPCAYLTFKQERDIILKEDP